MECNLKSSMQVSYHINLTLTFFFDFEKKDAYLLNLMYR